MTDTKPAEAKDYAQWPVAGVGPDSVVRRSPVKRFLFWKYTVAVEVDDTRELRRWRIWE